MVLTILVYAPHNSLDYVAFGQKLSHDLFENEEAGLPKTATRKRSSHSLHPSSTPTIPKRGRSTRVTPSKIARRTSSKTRIEEPWHSLIEAALVLHDGWQVDLPEVDTPYEDGSPSRSKLYQIALQLLHNATTLQVQTHFDRVHCLDFKDALVSLSGIWNLYSSAANNMFGITATAEAKAFCHMQSMDNKDDVLVDIAGVLLGKKTLEETLDETYHLQVAQPTYRRMLDVLQIIIRNIIRPLHGLKKEPSEADCLAVWSSIFQEGLPLNSLFSMNLGEQGCFSSALSKSKLADVFETGTTARKCDGLLSVNLVEVGNLEFKTCGRIEA
ncbi:hypothetical protein BKA57DRAFT_256923 [Linnemannia elongata]|nr:hypothetical protein BKA57DRAFT_256923 [Linnemannia elongata]